MFSDASSIIEKRLDDNWTTTPIQYDNVRYTPTVGTAFIRLQVEWATANVISIGGRIKTEGYVLLSIFTPAGIGSDTALGYADTLAALFNMYHEGALKLLAAVINRVGSQKEWYQVNVLIPFHYDSCWNFTVPCPPPVIP
jgi:hypothetical protein